MSFTTDMSNPNEVIQQIKRAFERQRPPISKNELARRAKIHRTTLYDFWSEKYEPTVKTVTALAEALHLKFTVSRKKTA